MCAKLIYILCLLAIACVCTVYSGDIHYWTYDENGHYIKNTYKCKLFSIEEELSFI
jgi:hypothetical protein